MRSAQQKLYEALGTLYYSLAHADKTVTAMETDALTSAVKQQWVPQEHSTDDFGTDAAFYISICFDYLNDRDASPDKAWLSFVKFYQEHPTLFTTSVKERMLKTALSVVEASSGINEAEHDRLKALKTLLKT